MQRGIAIIEELLENVALPLLRVLEMTMLIVFRVNREAEL